MHHETTEHLSNLMNSILATEAPEVVAAEPAKDRLLEQLRQLGMLERYVKVALQDCATELRREPATWAEIGDAFGSSLQSAYNRWNKGAVADAAAGQAHVDRTEPLVQD